MARERVSADAVEAARFSDCPSGARCGSCVPCTGPLGDGGSRRPRDDGGSRRPGDTDRPQTRSVARAGPLPIPVQLRGAFVVAAKKTDLPLPLLVAVARTESHFDSTARSSAGAIGVLQLMPATARALGVDPTDPHANVVAGARYLRSLFNRFGSAQLALAAYNAGPTSVAASAGALPTETRAYVANVRRTWRSLRRCR